MASRLVRAGALAACGLAVGSADAQQVQAKTTPPVAPPAAVETVSAAQRPIAYVYGNVPITREQLGEFLIARGGYEKVELLVNKVLIERACAEKNIVITPQMMEAALNDDLKGLDLKKDDFCKFMLPRYGKTFYEWMEDVIKPRLQLGELCKGRVKVSDDDLRIMFEHEYGEQRKIQIIMWPASDPLKAISESYAKLRLSQEEFDRAARAQANPSLAGAEGNVQPVRMHSTGDDKVVEREAWKLKEGEISGIIQLGGQNESDPKRGWMVMKLHKIIPGDATKIFEKEKAALYKDAYAKNLEKEIPVYFKELKEKAGVTILLKGPPAEWQVRAAAKKVFEGVTSGTGPVQTTGGTAGEYKK
ncbi:MAG TPA: hypothetical protein VGJ05_09410 [Fimbriiglobus sp.]|jgi:hypothetical protein